MIAASPFYEAQPPVWNPAYKLPGFVYAPQYIYPVRGKVYPFPFIRSAEADRHAAALVPELAHPRRFIIYGAGRNPGEWIMWFLKRPEMANWRPGSKAAV